MLDQLSWISRSGQNNGETIMLIGMYSEIMEDRSIRPFPSRNTHSRCCGSCYARHSVGVGVQIAQLCSPCLVILHSVVRLHVLRDIHAM
jgi:hypothetical protein